MSLKHGIVKQKTKNCYNKAVFLFYLRKGLLDTRTGGTILISINETDIFPNHNKGYNLNASRLVGVVS